MASSIWWTSSSWTSRRSTALIAVVTAVTVSIALTVFPLLVAEKRLAALGESR